MQLTRRSCGKRDGFKPLNRVCMELQKLLNLTKNVSSGFLKFAFVHMQLVRPLPLGEPRGYGGVQAEGRVEEGRHHRQPQLQHHHRAHGRHAPAPRGRVGTFHSRYFAVKIRTKGRERLGFRFKGGPPPFLPSDAAAIRGVKNTTPRPD